jgi:hypothetical protein
MLPSVRNDSRIDMNGKRMTEKRKRRTPRPPIHRTLLFRALRRQPFHQTMHVEDVGAFSPDCAHASTIPSSVCFSGRKEE